MVFLFYPLYQKWETAKNRRRRSARAQGVVTGMETRRGGNVRPGFDGACAPTQHPVVEFEVDGKTHRMVSDTGASWETLRQGQRVQVLYNPDKPEDAEIDDISLQSVEHLLLWLFPLIGAGVFLWGLVNFLRNLSG